MMLKNFLIVILSFIAITVHAKNSCYNDYQACKKVCRPTCKNNLQTAKDYKQYIKIKLTQGTNYIARDYASYIDPLTCSKVSCSCQADLRECLQYNCKPKFLTK